MNLLEEYGYAKDDIDKKIKDTYKRLFVLKTGSYKETLDGSYVLQQEGVVSSLCCAISLMVLVQLGKKQEFDSLWQWMNKYMLFPEGEYQGLYASLLDTQGDVIEGAGEMPCAICQQYIALSLVFACKRFCDASYGEEALTLLRACLHSKTRLWNQNTHLAGQIAGQKGDIVSLVQNAPQFSSLFSMFCDPRDADFWNMAASESIKLILSTGDKTTGLLPEFCKKDFSLLPATKGGTYFTQSYLTSFNIATYALWLGDLPALSDIAQKQMAFFYKMQIKDFCEYKLDGTKTTKKSRHNLALCAAVASLAVTLERRRGEAKKQEKQIALDAVKRFWDAPLKKSKTRHLDNLIYLLCLLALSGGYKVW